MSSGHTSTLFMNRFQARCTHLRLGRLSVRSSGACCHSWSGSSSARLGSVRVVGGGSVGSARLLAYSSQKSTERPDIQTRLYVLNSPNEHTRSQLHSLNGQTAACPFSTEMKPCPSHLRHVSRFTENTSCIRSSLAVVGHEMSRSRRWISEASRSRMMVFLCHR